MKKLVLAASFFIAFAADAQQGRGYMEKYRIEIQYKYQNVGKFVRLTPDQERKIDRLSYERLTEKEYNAKLKKILNKQQYDSYIASTQKDWRKDNHYVMNGPKPFRR